MWAALAAVALLWSYRSTLGSYLRDQHYQEHFLFLWVFLGLALAKSLRGPFRARFGFATRRDRIGVVFVIGAFLLLVASEVVGSSLAARTSLVLFVTGIALLVVQAWNGRRCLMHGLLMQLCFGFPYQLYFPITEKLQWGVAAILALPARIGLVGYTVEARSVRFADYELVITPDCAGFGQLLTFVGIAALGVLSSARNRRRTIGLLLLAVVLAWLSNLARVAMFVAFVGCGAYWPVEDPTWHSILGFLAFLPFVYLLVHVILRSHQPVERHAGAAPVAGRWPTWSLVLPMVAVQVLLSRGDVELPRPTYFTSLEHPPGFQLELHGPTEANDQAVYGTPWLLNARFRDGEGDWFDLLHYATQSHSHLCVHKVAACLHQPDQRVEYGAPVVVAGMTWWPIDLDRKDDDDAHVWFAFEIAGRRHDDSLSTQLQVFRQRLFGGSWEVKLTRVMFPGRLPPVPAAKEAAVLTWLGRLTASSP